MGPSSSGATTSLRLVGDSEEMTLKGDMSDVSLHKESGQILEAGDSLDFGDCYSGLIAVS